MYNSPNCLYFTQISAAKIQLEIMLMYTNSIFCRNVPSFPLLPLNILVICAAEVIIIDSCVDVTFIA